MNASLSYSILFVTGTLLIRLSCCADGDVRREFRSLNVTCTTERYIRLFRCLCLESSTCTVVVNVLNEPNTNHIEVHSNRTLAAKESGECSIVSHLPAGANPGSQQHVNYLCQQLTSFTCLASTRRSGGYDLDVDRIAGTQHTANSVDRRPYVGYSRRHRLECVYDEKISAIVVERSRNRRRRRDSRPKHGSSWSSFVEHISRGERSNDNSLKDTYNLSYIYVTWIIIGSIATYTVSVACVFLKCRNNDRVENGRNAGHMYSQSDHDVSALNVRPEILHNEYTETPQANHSGTSNSSQSRINNVSFNIQSQPAAPLPNGAELDPASGSTGIPLSDEGCVIMSGRETFTTSDSNMNYQREFHERILTEALTYRNICQASLDNDTDVDDAQDYVDMNQSHHPAPQLDRVEQDSASDSVTQRYSNEASAQADRSTLIQPGSAVKTHQQAGQHVLNDDPTYSSVSQSEKLLDVDAFDDDSQSYIDMNQSWLRESVSANPSLARFCSVTNAGQRPSDPKGRGTNLSVKWPALYQSYSAPVCSETTSNSVALSETKDGPLMQFSEEGMCTATEQNSVYTKLREQNRFPNNPYNDNVDRQVELNHCTLFFDHAERTPLSADSMNSSEECHSIVSHTLDSDYVNSDSFTISVNTEQMNNVEVCHVFNPVDFSYNCNEVMTVADSQSPQDYISGDYISVDDQDDLDDDFIDPTEWGVYAAKMKRVREMGIGMDLRLDGDTLEQNMDMASSNDELYVNLKRDDELSSLTSGNLIACPNDYTVCKFLKDKNKCKQITSTYHQANDNVFDNVDNVLSRNNDNAWGHDIIRPNTSNPNTITHNTTTPNTNIPNTTNHVTSIPFTSISNTSSPITSISNTSISNTSSPNTSISNTSSPTTISHITSNPNTSISNTSSPTTISPITSNPNTSISKTSSPTTISHITINPYTSISNTSSPTTLSPITSNPNTSISKTSSPTTISHITINPYTSISNTSSPTTLSPITSNPNTSISKTSSPTTISPNTSNFYTSISNISSPTTISPITINPYTSISNTSSPTTLSPIPSNPNTIPPNTTTPITIIPNTTIPLTSIPNTSSSINISPITSSPSASLFFTTSPTASSSNTSSFYNAITPNTSGLNSNVNDASRFNINISNTVTSNASLLNASRIKNNLPNTINADTNDPNRSRNTFNPNTSDSSTSCLTPNDMTYSPGACFYSNDSSSTNGMLDLIQCYIAEAREEVEQSKDNTPGKKRKETKITRKK